MRFPLIIPPLLLLILNWSSLDSDAVAFHNGSFVAVKSLDHIQFANTSLIDGNFTTRNTRFRKSSTHDVKPLARIDKGDISEETVSSQFTPDPQNSRGKRQKRDSREDELAQAEKNVTDLTSEINKISEKLKEKEEEASTVNLKYETAKDSLETQKKLAADWEDAEKARLDWVLANEELINANTALAKATENLKRANESLAEAEEKNKTVVEEPERLKNLTAEFTVLDLKYNTLKNDVNKWKDQLPILQQAATDAQIEVTHFDGEVSLAGCNGKESESRCSSLLNTLSGAIADQKAAQIAYESAVADNKKKIAELAVCEPEWTRLNGEISTLTANVAKKRREARLLNAESDVETAKEAQAPLLEEFTNAMKTHSEAAQKEQLSKNSFDAIEGKIPDDADAAKSALKSAENDFRFANRRKEDVDKAVNELKTTLGEKNAELAQANAKVEALKQNSKKDEPKTGALMYIGIGAGGGILLIILAIGGILFAMKRRKSKTKEEPSPTINPDALKDEKVPALDKSKQESASQSSQQATSAKSDTNVAATQSTSNKGATHSKSDTNIAATQLSSTPATRAQSDTNLNGANARKYNLYDRARMVYKGDKTPIRPRARAMTPTKHEKIAENEIEYIENRRPLINEIAKPRNSSKKPTRAQVPCELKWAGPKKAIAMQFVRELEKERPPEDAILYSVQDSESMVEESEDTQYDRTAPSQVNKTGADLLNEHVKNKTSVDDALKMATWIFVVVHQRLNFKYLSLLQLAAAARNVFEKETHLVESGLPATIFGDIHGQVGDAVRLINLATYDPANPKSRVLDLNKRHFVFCGDYVDRGNRQVETLVLLFSLKIAYPNNVHILRGNHETRDVNSRYGFLAELRDRYGEEDGRNLYDVFNEVFDHLPLACHIGGKILCVHGGISKHLHNLEDINKIPKPLPNIHVSPLAVDLLWADPMNGLSGTKVNEGRGISIHFGEDALEEFLKLLGLIVMFRGHQVPGNGFAWFGLKKYLCTFFSATGASKGNFVAAMHLDEKCEMTVLIMFKGVLFPDFTEEQSFSKSTSFHRILHTINNEKDDVYAEFKEDDQGICDMDLTRCG